MKKTIVLLLSLCFSFLFSQKEKMFKETYFPAKYVLKNSKDTIKTKILNIGLYDNDEFSPATYIRQITVLDPSDKKIKVEENDIQYLEMKDLKNVRRRFVNARSVLSKESGLLQVMYSGHKTQWYRKSFYTGPIYTYETKNRDYLIMRKDKIITEIFFKAPGVKPQLKELFGAYSDLSSMIDLMAEDSDLVKILERYDKK
ncbi:hypothetical protein ACKW6Q_01860 [Chryseobacterium kwangjuense]|uniref:DUF4468 domain-containing protein n=1 Tax=Chryseobacterium kwangjuense TaxID=267125 RepID=A0ABW9JZ82_9FLAO